MKKVRIGKGSIASLLAAALGLSAGSAGAATGNIEVDFEEGRTVARITITSADPVQGIVVESDDCEFGAAIKTTEFSVGAGETGTQVMSFWEAISTDSSCDHVEAFATLGEDSAPAPDCSFTGTEKVYVKKDAYTDSFDGQADDYHPSLAGFDGNVCGGKVKIGKDVVIHGDVRFGPDDKEPKDKGQVTGELIQLDEEITLEPVDLLGPMLVNDNANIPHSLHGEVVIDEKNELEIPSGDTLELPAGTYFVHKMKLGKDATLVITGPVTLFVGYKLDAGYGSIVNLSKRPSDLTILASGAHMKLGSHGDLHAQIHAPGSKIHRKGKGGGDFFGSIAGEKLKLYGPGGLHAVGGGAPGEGSYVFDLEWSDGE